MALTNYCDTAPFEKADNCDKVSMNWIKLKETYDVLCCLLDSEITLTDYCYTEANVTGKTTFDLPAAWGTISEDKADYMVFYNGQLRSFVGLGLGEFEWSVSSANRQITFTDALGTADNPGVFEVRYTRKGKMSELLTCATTTGVTSC